MESEAKPVGVFAPLVFVCVGELGEVEFFMRVGGGAVIEDVEGKFSSIFLVQSSEHFQIPAVEDGFVFVFGDVA